MKISKIISGGQTGADRGGLDAAIKLGIPHGGYCPKRRRAEDGTIPETYKLTETAVSNYLFRTEKNVMESDITLIFTKGKACGGSKKTIELARKHGKPYVHVDTNMDIQQAANKIIAKLNKWNDGIVVNVAGSRESKCPNICEYTKQVVELVIANEYNLTWW